MSKRATPYEARAHFRHDGEDRRPGDTVELTAEQAAELEALGFVVRAVDYRRRDMKAKA